MVFTGLNKNEKLVVKKKLPMWESEYDKLKREREKYNNLAWSNSTSEIKKDEYLALYDKIDKKLRKLNDKINYSCLLLKYIKGKPVPCEATYFTGEVGLGFSISYLKERLCLFKCDLIKAAPDYDPADGSDVVRGIKSQIRKIKKSGVDKFKLVIRQATVSNTGNERSHISERKIVTNNELVSMLEYGLSFY